MKTLEDKISIIFAVLMALILLFVLSSCSSSIYKVRKEQIKVTHVLAITENGDTLQIPIEAIKPNVIYNIIGYNYGHRPRYYYRPFNYIYDYYPYNFGNNINYSGSTFSISTIRPTIQINVPSSGGNFGGPSGTSGFSGNPTAVNPVTSGGGVKKKNN